MAGTNGLSTAGRVYVNAVIAGGSAIVALSLYTLATSPVRVQWFILAGLTLLSGSFTVRIPAISARLSVSETFVFAAALLFGPAAATVIVVLDTLIISLWQGRRSTPERVLFNAAAPAVAIWVAATLFFALAGVPPLYTSPPPILSLVPALLALAIAYFFLNTWLIAWAVAFQKRLSVFAVWQKNFSWLSVNYLSGASVAALLLPYLRAEDQSGLFRVLGILLPLLLVSYLTLRTALGRVDDANRHLNELNKLYLSTIETLAMAIDAKDQITHGHIRRVQSYAVGLARSMGVNDETQIKAVEAAALLHDMGKLAVPEYILNKPGPLTPAEFEKMKLHASVGADILKAIDFPYPVVPIVRHHHENWDGTGYPDKLKGTEIPVGARILSVVDCFDALTSDRPYRPRLADKDALRILIDRRGTMYDPLVVDAFMKVHDELAPVAGVTSPEEPFAAITDAAVSPRAQFITRTQPLEDIAASSEEMLTLFTLARELTGRMSVADIGDVLLKHLRRLVPSSLCAFFLHDEEATDLVASHVSGENAEAIHGLRIPLGQRLSGWVGANRQSIRNSDPLLDFGDTARTMSPRLRSCLSTPLIAGDKLVGVLSLYARPADAFTEDHQRLVEIVARQVSPVLQRSIEYMSSSVRAFRDPLTGLPNIEHLKQLAAEQEQLAELPIPSSLIYVDVNDLKTINISHGRGVGDQALRDVVQQLRSNLRSADVLFRLESDEFAVLLLQTDRQTAGAIAARMKTSVQQVNIGGGGRVGINVTTAVVSSPEDGIKIDALIDSARRRLAKPRNVPPDSNSKPTGESIH
jgi:diguanylate cyclase (GGDEF)-like protein/putative nucleotidyltransferase with HDIG domain